MRAALSLLATALLFGCAGVPTTPGSPRAERPTYALGERWIRNDGVYELIRIENDRYVFSSGPGREVRLTTDLALARVQTGTSYLELDPPPGLAWPLEIGKSGAASVAWQFPTRSPEVRLAWKVEAYEDVHVPAGTFKAFRIAYSTMAGFAPWALAWPQVSFVIWYAPEARQYVKLELTAATSPRPQFWEPLTFHVVAVDRPEGLPVRIVLREPKDQARVTTEAITVTGGVAAGKGVTRLAVILNGLGVWTQDERAAPKPELILDLPLTLREGKNVLLVTATDAAGETRQEARTLFYDRPRARAPAPAPVTAPPAVAAPVPPAPPPPIAAAPFQVALASPRDQARVEQESIGLAGLVSGGKGVSRIVVTLNGVEVARQEEPAPSLALNLPLKLRDGPNTLVVTATEADGTLHQEVRTVHYEKLVPLTIAIRYPEDRARFTDEATVVAALAESSKGIARVTVTLNGAEIHQQAERTPQRSLVVTAPLTLREGVNTLVVAAAEPDGTRRQELRTIVYDKPKVAAVPAPAVPPPAVPERWAVVVGVGRYEHPDIPRLRYTVPDAEAIYDTLIGPAGFKKEHVLLLTDKTEKKPTIRNLRWALGTFLARSAKKDDTVVIFFAGHGAPEVDPRGLERDGFAKYLVPIDAEPDDLFSTALPMDDIHTIFGRIEAERVVAFLDTCYSGAAGGRTFASKKTRAGHVDELFLERLTRSKGRAIITASRPSEVSVELPELGHGLFTYYLVQGLRGAADLNRDGIVALQELYEYVEREVSRKSRAVGANQHPVMKGELEGVLPLVKVAR